MKGDGLFFCERNRNIARVDWIATKLDLRDCGTATSVDHANPTHLRVRLTGSGYEFALSRINFVLVWIAQLANDGVLLAGLIARTLQIDEIAIGKFRGTGRIKTARHKGGIRHRLFRDEASTIKGGGGGR